MAGKNNAAGKNDTAGNNDTADQNDSGQGELIAFKAKSTTGYPVYRRQGLKFGPQFTEQKTTAEILELLKKDVHLVIKENKE